jgi:hypothetical protein
MGVDLNALRKRHDSEKRMDYWRPEEGIHLVYIALPLEGEPLPFLDVHTHYEILGDKKKVSVCLDKEKNVFLDSPRFRSKTKKNVDGGCPVCEKLNSGYDIAKKALPRYHWGVFPLKYKVDVSRPNWRDSDYKNEYMVLSCGKQVYEGLKSLLFSHGDITDPNAAIYAVIEKKEGKKIEYKVSADPECVREQGVKVPKSIKSALTKHLVDGGKGDFYSLIAPFIRSREEVQALIDGVEYVDEDKEEKEEKKKPDCFALKFESDDEECNDCEYSNECSKMTETEEKTWAEKNGLVDDEDDDLEIDAALERRKKTL